MKSKMKIFKVITAVAVAAAMLIGILPVTAETVFAANVSHVKEAGASTLLTKEDLAKLGNGQTYKINNSFQYANFEGRQWLMAGGTNSDFTGNKDGLVLWAVGRVGYDRYGAAGNLIEGIRWSYSLLYNRLNSSDEQYRASYNVNNLISQTAKNYLLPVTLEDWSRVANSYNNYLYIADRNDAGNGVFLGPKMNEFQITFDEYKRIQPRNNLAWLRSAQGLTRKMYAVAYDGSTDIAFYKTYQSVCDPIVAIIPTCVMDLTKTALATTSPEAASLSEGKHVLSPGTMNFRFINDDKIKSTIEYTDDYICVKKDENDEDVYLCVQYATCGSPSNEEIYTRKIHGDTILGASEIGINTYKCCTVWLEKKDSTDNLVYAKEGTYYQTPSLSYTSYGVTEEFTPGVASRKALGKVSYGGFAPSFNPDVTVEITDKSGEPASTSLWAFVEDGELIVTTTDVTGPGSYYLRIKVSDGKNTKYSEKIPVTVGKLDHAQNEKSVSVAAESEETYSTMLFWPAEGGSYGTPKVEGTIKATDISISSAGGDNTLTFTVPFCDDGSTGKIIIPVTGCKIYKDYNIVINLSAYGKKETYWSKGDLENFGYGRTYYVKSGVLQKASFAGKEWYAVGVEQNANTNDKAGLVLLSASPICERVYNSGYDADYATSALNAALNSNDAPYASEACNVNQLFTGDERACILPVNVNYSLESTSKTVNNVLLYVPDGDYATSLYRNSVRLGTTKAFEILVKEWKGADSGYFWCRSRVNSDGRVYVANVNADWKTLSVSYVNETCSVVPVMDLDISKVLFASAAPVAASSQTADVTANDTMVFRFDGTEKISSTIAAGAENQTYEITKSAEDTQPVYLCAQYNTVSGAKIYTQLITEDCQVDLNSIFEISSDVKIWIETTSPDGRLVYAKKVQPAISYKAADPSPAIYANTENNVSLGTVAVIGYSDSDVIMSAVVYEGEDEGAAEITDGSIGAYIDNGKLCVATTTQVKEGTYRIRINAASQYFTGTLTRNVTANVVKRDYSTAALSVGIAEGTTDYSISDYTPNGGGTLGEPVTSGDLNITNVKTVKKYSTYGISFTVTDAKAGQTGRIEIPVSGCKAANDYKLVILVNCAANALTWYAQDDLKSLGINGVYYKNADRLLRAEYAGRTWAVVGNENSINTGNRDTLIMVSTDSVATSAFNEADMGSNYTGSRMYNLLNSSASAYAGLDGNAHKIFGDAIKYVVPVTINYTDENGGTSAAPGNYLYLPDGDTSISGITMGTTGNYSMPLDSYINNVNTPRVVNQNFYWLRSAAKLNYVKSIVKNWTTYLGERFMMSEDGLVIPEFNLDLQNVLFASTAAAGGEGTKEVNSNSNLVFRFRDSAEFNGKVYYSGEGTKVSVILDRVYTEPVYLRVQYEEDGMEKLYSVQVTSSGTIDLKDNVKGGLSAAHIWLEMKDSLSGIVYAVLSEENAHEHSWQYDTSEDGKTLEAWCGTGDSGNCEYGEKNKVTLTLEAESHEYAGATYEVMVNGTEKWEKAGLEIPAVLYEGVDGTSYAETEQPPYNAGTYQAKISAGGATATVQFTISCRTLTVTGTSVENKVYDGSTASTVNVGSVTGFVDGDDVKLRAAGSFSDENAGDNKTVKVEYTLSGEDAVNYTVPDAEYFTANITKKAISVTADSLASKVGQPVADLTFTSDRLAEGDAFEGEPGTDPTPINTSAAGTYTITQGTLSAGDNYVISFTEGKYTVTSKKTRKISFKDIQPESAAEPETVESDSIVVSAEGLEPDTPELVDGNITITYGDWIEFIHTVKEDVTVTYSSSVESVATVDASTGQVTIVGAGTTVIKAVAEATDEYEQAEAAYTLTVLKQPVDVPEVATGLVYNGDSISCFAEETGTLYDKSGDEAVNAGEYTATVSLKDKNNYIWNTPAPTTENRSLCWNIGRKRLSVTGSSADKVYDGSALATVTVGEVEGIVEKAGVPDDVEVSAEGMFERPSAADNKKVWVDYSISGEDKDNYLEPFSGLIAASITPKKLSISGTRIADREYDGTRSAVADCGTVTGKLEEDDVLVLGWAAFTDKNAGNDKEVVVVYALMGEQAGNYEAPDMETLTADITKAGINVEASNRQSYVGNELMPLGYTYDNLFDGDSFSGKLATDADPEKAGTYSITLGTLNAGDNYDISFTPGTYEVQEKLTQSIQFVGIEGNALTKTYGDSDYTNAVTGACTKVVLKSSNEKVAVIDGMNVKIVGVGTAVITAVAEENDIYASAEAGYTLTVNPPANPRTGDGNNAVLFIILMAATLALIGLVLLRRRANRV